VQSSTVNVAGAAGGAGAPGFILVYS
jgi:hypothetical protein